MKDLFWPLIESLIGNANKPLSNELYSEVSFVMEMLIPFIVSAVLLIVFYFLIDPSGKSKNKKWYWTFLLSFFISGALTWLLLSQNGDLLRIAMNQFDGTGLRIFNFAFSLVNSFYCFAVFFILSIVFRRFSTNNKITPPILKKL